MSLEADPQHPVLDRPWEYTIVGFNYQGDEGEPFLELSLRRGDDFRRLRFLSPRDIKLDAFFAAGPSGIAILDVSARQMEGVRVWVCDDVTGHDCLLTFWAREVLAQ